MRTAALALFAVTLSAIAQLILKLGTLKITAGAPSAVSLRDTLLLASASPMVWTGLMVYAASAVVWVGVLARMQLSVAYPLVAFSIVLTCIFGRVLLGEPIGFLRALGVALIIAGVVLVGLTGRITN